MHEFTIESAEDKGTLVATSPLSLYRDDLAPSNILDGNPNGLAFHPSVGPNYPWIQVTLPKEVWVKGVKLYVRSNVHRQEFYEVNNVQYV